jgi:hypothetical protein
MKIVKKTERGKAKAEKESLRLVEMMNTWVSANFGYAEPDPGGGEEARKALGVKRFAWEWVLPTIVGPLRVTIFRGECNWIFTAFDAVDLASKVRACNKCNGKWNWLVEKGTPVGDLFQQFASGTETLLVVPKHPEIMEKLK